MSPPPIFNISGQVLDVNVTGCVQVSGAVTVSGELGVNLSGCVGVRNCSGQVLAITGMSVTVNVYSNSGSTGTTSGEVVQIVSGMGLLDGVQSSGCFLPCSAADGFQVSGNYLTPVDVSGIAHLSDISGQFTLSGTAMASGINLTSSAVVGIVSGMAIGGGGISGAGLSGQVAVFGSLKGYSGLTYLDSLQTLNIGVDYALPADKEILIGNWMGPAQIEVYNNSSTNIKNVTLGDTGYYSLNASGQTQTWNGTGIVTNSLVVRSGITGPAMLTSADVLTMVSGQGLFAFSGTGGGTCSGYVTSSQVVSMISGQTSGMVVGAGTANRIAIWMAATRIGDDVKFRVVGGQMTLGPGTQAAPIICYSGRTDAGIFNSGGHTNIVQSGITASTFTCSGITANVPITDCSGHVNNWYQQSGVTYLWQNSGIYANSGATVTTISGTAINSFFVAASGVAGEYHVASTGILYSVVAGTPVATINLDGLYQIIYAADYDIAGSTTATQDIYFSGAAIPECHHEVYNGAAGTVHITFNIGSSTIRYAVSGTAIYGWGSPQGANRSLNVHQIG